MLITNNIISKYKDFLEKEIQLSHDRQHRLDLILIEFVLERASCHFLLLSSSSSSSNKHLPDTKYPFEVFIYICLCSTIIQTVNIGASVASARPASENRRRSTRQSMSSTPTPGRPSMPTIINKKFSSATNDSISPPTNINRTKRATSSENFRSITAPSMKKESSSGFNYQSLTESSPLNVSRSRTILKAPVRSHSSTNAELSYHLQQLRNLGRRKTTMSGEDRNNQTDDRIRLTSSNLKVECDENGVLGSSIHTTMELETIEASIELPVSWKPAIQQITIQRDAWDHKVEFLLAVIGYAVDLGRRDSLFERRVFLCRIRECLAISSNCVFQWRWSVFHPIYYSFNIRWITIILV